jgi:hypothetical protein
VQGTRHDERSAKLQSHGHGGPNRPMQGSHLKQGANRAPDPEARRTGMVEFVRDLRAAAKQLR